MNLQFLKNEMIAQLPKIITRSKLLDWAVDKVEGDITCGTVQEIAKQVGIKVKINELCLSADISYESKVKNTMSLKIPREVYPNQKYLTKEEKVIHYYIDLKKGLETAAREAGVSQVEATKILVDSEYRIRKRTGNNKVDIDTEKFKELVGNGMTIRELEEHFNCSRPPILRLLKVHKLEVNKKIYKKAYEKEGQRTIDSKARCGKWRLKDKKVLRKI